MLHGEQIRAARALAMIDQKTLAHTCGDRVSLPTIKRLEGDGGPISANTGTEEAIRNAFDAMGVLFIDADGLGPGVRLKVARPAPAKKVRKARAPA